MNRSVQPRKHRANHGDRELQEDGVELVTLSYWSVYWLVEMKDDSIRRQGMGRVRGPTNAAGDSLITKQVYTERTCSSLWQSPCWLWNVIFCQTAWSLEFLLDPTKEMGLCDMLLRTKSQKSNLNFVKLSVMWWHNSGSSLEFMGLFMFKWFIGQC